MLAKPDTFQRATTTDDEIQTKRFYTVAGRGKLDLYRLCCQSDGMSIKTDTVATAPKDDIFVELNFSCPTACSVFPNRLTTVVHIFGPFEQGGVAEDPR